MGDTVFEILAVSHELKAIIFTFGERLANMAYQARVTILKVHSEYKETLKQKANIKRALRLMGYGLSFKVVSHMMGILGSSIIPIDLQEYTNDIGLGLIIIADG